MRTHVCFWGLVFITVMACSECICCFLKLSIRLRVCSVLVLAASSPVPLGGTHFLKVFPLTKMHLLLFAQSLLFTITPNEPHSVSVSCSVCVLELNTYIQKHVKPIILMCDRFFLSQIL